MGMPLSADDKLRLEDFQQYAESPVGDAAVALARAIIENCPAGRPRSLALERVEEALLFADKALRRE